MTKWISVAAYAQKHGISRAKVYQDILYKRFKKGEYTEKKVVKKVTMIDEKAPVYKSK